MKLVKESLSILTSAGDSFGCESLSLVSAVGDGDKNDCLNFEKYDESVDLFCSSEPSFTKDDSVFGLRDLFLLIGIDAWFMKLVNGIPGNNDDPDRFC